MTGMNVPMRGGPQPAQAGAGTMDMAPPVNPGGMIQAEQGQAMSQMADINGLRNNFMMQIRQLASIVNSMSQTFPAFAPMAEQIMQLAQQGMVQTVASLGAQEPTPNPMAMI